MPRIGAALAVVATLGACIAVNTWRYPVVREMVAAVPPLEIALRPREAPTPPPAPEKATPPREPQVARASPGACPEARPFDLAAPPALAPRLPSLATGAETPALEAGARPDERGATDFGAPRARAESPVPARRAVTLGQLQAGLPLAPLADSHWGSGVPAAGRTPGADGPAPPEQPAPPRIVQVRARPAGFDVQPETADKVEPLPPVDQVWPADRGPVAPPQAGERFPMYPTTGIE